MRKPAVRSARPPGALAVACGIAAMLAAAAADAQRGRDGMDIPRGPAAKAERAASAMSVPPPKPPKPVRDSTNVFPGPDVRLPGGQGMNNIPGPNNVLIGAPGGGAPGGGALAGGQASLFAAPSVAASPRVFAPAPGAAALAAPVGSTPAAAPAASRVTEIIPTPSQAAAAPQGGREPARTPAAQGNLWASTDPCVNVFVRAAKVDGRDVVSVDLHGDGLIKGAVPLQLAGELLARTGPESAGGARAACVPPALARSLFDPVINLAGFDAAARMTQVGGRWVLASGNEPAPTAAPPALVQLAAATPRTRGQAKQPAKPTRAADVLATRLAPAKPVARGPSTASPASGAPR